MQVPQLLRQPLCELHLPGAAGTTPGSQQPASGGCAGPVSRDRAERPIGSGRGWTRPSRGLLWGSDPSPPGAPLGLRAPAVLGMGAGQAAGPGLPVRLQRAAPEPLWAALRPQPGVSPGCVVTKGRASGTVLTRPPGLMRGRSCALWGPRPFFLHWGNRFLLSFLNVWGAGSQIHDPAPPAPHPLTGLVVNPKPTSLQPSEMPASRLRFAAKLPAICAPGCI